MAEPTVFLPRSLSSPQPSLSSAGDGPATTVLSPPLPSPPPLRALPPSPQPSIGIITQPFQIPPSHISAPAVSTSVSPSTSPTTTIPSSNPRTQPSPASLASKTSSRTATSGLTQEKKLSVDSSFWEGTPSRIAEKGGVGKGSVAFSSTTGVVSVGRKGKENEPLPLTRFVMYETKTRYYIFASNQSSIHSNRVLKIDRTSDELVVIEDSVIYSHKQLAELKKMIELGNKNVGGFVEVMSFYGIAGFVRFTQGWYMILITKRQAIAIIAGHYVYHCDETVMKPISKFPPERTAEELRQYNTFQKIDLAKHFYFSYTYDITSSLQNNLTGVRTSFPSSSSSSTRSNDYSSAFRITTRYMWNYRLLKCAFPQINEEGRSWKGSLGGALPSGGAGGTGGWVLPLVHGFVDQAKLDIMGRAVYITLIGRRSRLFAGARYLKRGANDLGHVANEVESEQIVSEPLTTPFHCKPPRNPHDGPCAHPEDDPEHQLHELRLKSPNPRFTSYVQYRGSIPLLWSQDASASNFKPPIDINNVDPYFSAAARHFDGLLEKYGGPIIVLNLVKSIESTPRESKLLHEFTQCVSYLNQFLPDDKQLVYIPWDMSKANKTKHQDTMKILDEISEEAVAATGFFHSGRMIREDGTVPYRDRLRLQQGVTRSNCVDCLDRTNIAQFSLGKKALGAQLYALGIIPTPDISFYSDANFLFTEMYHDHGDTLALQYSGGALVNRLDTYQKNLQWTSHSRDMIENIKRYYANSMLDAEKQLATDLFLGITKDSRALESSQMPRRPYDDWFDPSHLEQVVDVDTAERRMRFIISQACDFWEDYYRPRLYTSFERHYASRVNSSIKFLSKQNGPNPDPSPFAVRAMKVVPPLGARKPMNPVRRWMSSETRHHPRSASSVSSALSRKVATPEDQLSEVLSQEGGVGKLDPMSIEAKVLKSADPVLSEAEEEEYLRWSASHEDEVFSSHSLGRSVDLDLYTTTVSLQDSTIADSWTEDHSDTKSYASYTAFEDFLRVTSVPTTAATGGGGEHHPRSGGSVLGLGLAVTTGAAGGAGGAGVGTGGAKGGGFGGAHGWTFAGVGGGGGKRSRERKRTHDQQED